MAGLTPAHLPTRRHSGAARAAALQAVELTSVELNETRSFAFDSLSPKAGSATTWIDVDGAGEVRAR
jgi:hypothetical protein